MKVRCVSRGRPKSVGYRIHPGADEHQNCSNEVIILVASSIKTVSATKGNSSPNQ